jgi:3-hydroxy-9,10-secoandrosta-1,3,5(10)-triene-9,17-dione monooxygenase
MRHSNTMTHAEAVRRARALAPAIAARVLRCESERRIPIESVQEFVGEGLGRILQPKRWGGFEISHDAAFDVSMEISKACGSSGWCLGFLNIHDWWVAGFPEEAQHDVWRDGPDVNLAGVIAPLAGRARAVDGGYRVSGQWSWASGVDHCTWAIITAMVEAENGSRRAHVFLVPKTDYAVKDTWFNVGMRGTGSHDIIVDDAFVPAHRSITMDDLREGTTPGTRVNTGPLYAIPLEARRHALSAPALGVARAAFDHWADWMRTKVSSATGEAIAQMAPAQISLANAEVEIDTAEFLLRRNLDFIRAGGPIDADKRAISAAAGAQAVQKLCKAVDLLFQSSGSRGLFDGSPLQRAWRDVHTIASHFALNPETSAQMRARVLLGLPAAGKPGD